jgi:alkaline phosphatase
LAAAALPAAAERAKNVILFIGDAAGIPVLNAASIHGYQEPRRLYVQRMPNIALSETSAADVWVTDSAAGMTAIVTGHKTNNGVLSQTPPPKAGEEGRPLKTILEYAEERGLATGVVSNSAMSDATPAACYSHAGSRRKTGEIFQQVWQPRFGDGIDVIIGPGRSPISKALTELGLDLAKGLTGAGLPFFESIADAPKEARRAVVLFDGSDFDLGEAADKAVEILSKNSKGFFLMVECDLHTDNPKRGLDRAVSFDRTIERIAKRWSRNSLILFTADHSFDLRVQTGKRGQPIGLPAKSTPRTAIERLPATDIRVDGTHTGEEVLVAAQGPGSERVRGVLSNTDLFHIMMAAYGWRVEEASRR